MTYSHSGKTSPLGFVIALGLGLIIALLLGFTYNFFVIYMPLVYVNFFITFGFGVVLGYCNKFFTRFGKIRNDRHVLLMSILIGFAGFYFQWIAYFMFLITNENSFQTYQHNFAVFFNPVVFLDMLLELNKFGSWEIFGIMFKDFALWIVWFFEAFLIIGIPIIIALKHPIVPFSELLNKWYRKYTLKEEFESIAGKNEFKRRLFEDIENTINNLSYGAPFRFSEISIYYLEGEEDQYLSVDNVFREERGKGKTKRTPVVHLLKIKRETAKNLMDKNKTKKQFLFDY